MMKKYTIFFYLISMITSVIAKDNGILNPQMYNVWTIEEPALKIMVQEEIEYYVGANPEDSMRQISYNDKVIIIESKKNPGNIFEVRYGSSGDYQSIDEKQVKWVLPKNLRSEIIGNPQKKYFYVSDDSYIRDVQNSLEREYFSNQFHWTGTDLYISSGSKSIIDQFIFRPRTLGGMSINASNAFSIKVGDELLGYPAGSKGNMNFGLLSPYYELGIQTPIMEALADDNLSRVILEEGISNSYLHGGIGGYGKVRLYQFHLQLGFAEMGENMFVKPNVIDSAFVDYLSLSVFAGYDFNFEKPFLRLGYFKAMLGYGFYQISHKSLTSDNQYVERFLKRNGETLAESITTFSSPMIRLDFITPIKQSSAPLLHLFTQVNPYKGNRSWQTGAEINIKSFGIDVTYKHSVDDVDWAPRDELFLSINYSY